ncbi:MAG: branched-chain amino acid ABC transporter permease [Nitriliruptorales bacterium]
MATTADVRADEARGLKPPPEVDLRAAVRHGLISGAAALFVAAAGMVENFEARVVVRPGITLGYIMLLAIPAIFGYVAASPPPEVEGTEAQRPGRRNVLAGTAAGALTAGLLLVFVAFTDAVDVRSIFLNNTPFLREEMLLFGLGFGAGSLLLLVACMALGAAAASFHLLPERARRAALLAVLIVLVFGTLQPLAEQLFRGARLPGGVQRFLYGRGGGLGIPGALVLAALGFGSRYFAREKGTVRRRIQELPQEQRLRWSIVGAVLVLVLLAVLPQVLGQFMSEVFDIAGIFLLMALGLNIVVGYAGLLDLGYVAFFAVGAYTTAVLTSPLSPRFSPEMAFWAALPFVVAAAAVAGIMVGTPVLRMRGDYLAIVTLGFGEIARIVLLSNWQTPNLGGAQGILQIPCIPLGVACVRQPQPFLYLIYGFILVAIWISWSLQESRVGRAWMAMREDEPVAEAMGVDIVRAKLSAFIVGAILASFGGALFAHKIGSVFPHSFDIVVSITVLVVVIVGGMASIPGVFLGAFVIVGLPELLREFQEFKFLFYGALLIFMMLKRPEGFIPSKRRAQELHQEEVEQDAWLGGSIDQAERGPAATS